MYKLLVLAVCLASAVAAMSDKRAKRAMSFASSSAGSGAGVGVSTGAFGDGFRFPTVMPAVGQSIYPAYGFTNAFQQFLDVTNAAQIAASRDPVFAKVYKEQMAILANLQQMAQIQYPFAFPGFEFSNSVAPEVNTWNTRPAVSGYMPAVVSTVVPTGVPSMGTDSAVFTSGVVGYGNQGGYGVASSFPGGPDGLGVRISEEFPAPVGGGPFGTFSSSSSGVSNVNGRTTSYKTSTIGVNENGRITFRTISE